MKRKPGEEAAGAEGQGDTDQKGKMMKKNVSTDSDNKRVQLNGAQAEAVSHPFGPVLIVAGPGTGKTLTLTHRIAFLIDRKKVSPEKILAITFTNKAAREMQNRLEKSLSQEKKNLWRQRFINSVFNFLKKKRLIIHIRSSKNRTAGNYWRLS